MKLAISIVKVESIKHRIQINKPKIQPTYTIISKVSKWIHKEGSMSSGTLFHENHPRRLVPELSAQFHKNNWFVGNGAGGFLSIKQGDSVYIAASNVAKDRMTSDDLYVYNSGDSSVTLSPAQDRKLMPCELAGLVMLIFKERKGTGAVLHCNGKIPCLTSLLYSGSEFKMTNQGIIKGLYNEALRRNYNMDEIVTVPIVDDLSQEKLKEALQKYSSPNAIIVRNRGVFIWAEDWQKCRAAAECYHQLMDISIEMEKFGINPYTTLPATTYASNEVSVLSSISTLDEVVTTPSQAASVTTPLKKNKGNPNSNSINNIVSVPSTSNANTSSEKPKQKNVTNPKTTPTANKKTAENEKTGAKTPNRRQQNQTNGVKQGRVMKRNGINKGGRGGGSAMQGPNRRSAERQLVKRSRGGNHMGGPNQGPVRPLMGPPGPMMGGPNAPMMNPGGSMMGGPHGTFTGGPTNNGPPMGGPGFGGPQGPMMDGPMGPMNPQGPMGPGGPMGPMGPRGPMRPNPMMQAQMRAAQHHAAKQQQRGIRGRGPKPGGSGQKRGAGKVKGGVKKGGEKNMPNKDVLMNY